jgi:hypothetical protein
MRYPFKYRVVTDVSSKEDAEIDEQGRQILLKTNNYLTARKECIQWAAYDDIQVWLLGPYGQKLWDCDGAAEAYDRFPKTAELV